MALKIDDRVRETTTTAGTGTVTLLGAVSGFETFASNLSDSDTTYYAIVDSTNGTFEVGLGTYSSNTLARTTPIASSNSNNKVNFASVAKDVFITLPASKMAFLDGSGNLISTGGSSVVNTDLSNDTSPQLGGNLDVNGNDIISASGNANIEVAPHGTGGLVVKGNNTGSENQGKIILNCQNNSHGQTIKSQPHNLSASNTLLLPGGNTIGNSDSTLVSEVGTQTLTNKTFGDNVSFGDNNITNVGDIAVDSISPDGTDINVAVSDNSATAFTIKQSTNNYLVIDTGDGGESVAIGTGVSGTAISIGHTTSETTVNDNLTVTGNLTVSGTTTTVDSTTINVQNTLVFEGSTANEHETTLTTVDPTADRTISLPNVSGTLPVLAAASTTQITSTPEELNLLDGVSGLVQADFTKLAAVDATASELNLLDGGTSVGGSITIADSDGIIVNDGGTMKSVPASDIKTYAGSGFATTDDATALAIALG